MVDGREHPKASEDICGGLSIDVIDAGSAYSGVLVKNIVPLNLDHQFVVEKIAGDIAIQ